MPRYEAQVSSAWLPSTAGTVADRLMTTSPGGCEPHEAVKGEEPESPQCPRAITSVRPLGRWVDSSWPDEAKSIQTISEAGQTLDDRSERPPASGEAEMIRPLDDNFPIDAELHQCHRVANTGSIPLAVLDERMMEEKALRDAPHEQFSASETAGLLHTYIQRQTVSDAHFGGRGAEHLRMNVTMMEYEKTLRSMGLIHPAVPVRLHQWTKRGCNCDHLQSGTGVESSHYPPTMAVDCVETTQINTTASLGAPGLEKKQCATSGGFQCPCVPSASKNTLGPELEWARGVPTRAVAQDDGSTAERSDANHGADDDSEVVAAMGDKTARRGLASRSRRVTSVVFRTLQTSVLAKLGRCCMCRRDVVRVDDFSIPSGKLSPRDRYRRQMRVSHNSTASFDFFYL